MEVTRLYAETNTPIADIAGRFGIGESSVYRVAKRHGAALRGRVGRSSGGADNSSSAAAASADGATSRPRGRRRGSGTAAAGSPGTSGAETPAPTSTRRRRASTTPASNGRRTRRSAAPAARGGRERRRFRINYLGVVVVEASGIREALVIAESRGARDVTSVHRED
ncbi:MAG: hypothetical protein JO023_13880 [Chloroflexi bacterium]|nr:hypothetical protein [Chloroflexota bacterium]